MLLCPSVRLISFALIERLSLSEQFLFQCNLLGAEHGGAAELPPELQPQDRGQQRQQPAPGPALNALRQYQPRGDCIFILFAFLPEVFLSCVLMYLLRFNFASGYPNFTFIYHKYCYFGRPNIKAPFDRDTFSGDRR